MGFGLSVPEETRKTLPNGKLAPVTCLICYKVAPCEHTAAASADAAELVAVAVRTQPSSDASRQPMLTPRTAPDLSASVALPTEDEKIDDVRRSLQAPQLIQHMVAFAESLLKCHSGDEGRFAQQFEPIKRQADFLCARHTCIQDNKGKGVLITELLAAHMRDVDLWIAECDRFNHALCGGGGVVRASAAGGSTHSTNSTE